MNEIEDNIKAEWTEKEPSWTEVFSNGTSARNLQRVLLGMGPYMMNQWSGINALCYYLAYILQEYLDYSPSMALILASVAFTQYAVFSWPPFFYIGMSSKIASVSPASTFQFHSIHVWTNR